MNNNDDVQSKLRKAVKSVDSLSHTKKFSIREMHSPLSNKISETKLSNTSEEALTYQDIEIRGKYIDAVQKDIDSRKKVRMIFLNFYLVFVSIVTLFIFFVIIDPVQLWRDQDTFYPIPLKLTLVGTFFANLISIALIMVKYSFASVDNIISAFEHLSRKKKKKHKTSKLRKNDTQLSEHDIEELFKLVKELKEEDN